MALLDDFASNAVVSSLFDRISTCWIVHPFFAGDRHWSLPIATVYHTIYSISWCQCPLGLISHFYIVSTVWLAMVSLVSMPSRADISFLRKSRLDKFCLFKVSMPSRADISFLRYPFKNLGFMRFPEPVFAGICQNILTTAVFRAC